MCSGQKLSLPVGSEAWCWLKTTGSVAMQMYNKPKKAAQEEVRLIASPFAKTLNFLKYKSCVGTVIKPLWLSSWEA